MEKKILWGKIGRLDHTVCPSYKVSHCNKMLALFCLHWLHGKQNQQLHMSNK